MDIHHFLLHPWGFVDCIVLDKEVSPSCFGEQVFVACVLAAASVAFVVTVVEAATVVEVVVVEAVVAVEPWVLHMASFEDAVDGKEEVMNLKVEEEEQTCVGHQEQLAPWNEVVEA